MSSVSSYLAVLNQNLVYFLVERDWVNFLVELYLLDLCLVTFTEILVYSPPYFL